MKNIFKLTFVLSITSICSGCCWCLKIHLRVIHVGDRRHWIMITFSKFSCFSPYCKGKETMIIKYNYNKLILWRFRVQCRLFMRKSSPLLDLMLTPYSHNPWPCILYSTHPKHEKNKIYSFYYLTAAVAMILYSENNEATTRCNDDEHLKVPHTASTAAAALCVYILLSKGLLLLKVYCRGDNKRIYSAWRQR